MKLIFNIIDTINNDNYYGISEEIELLKGKNKIKTSIKEIIEQIKRKYLFFLKNNKT